jgi:hypothetical protein
MNRRKGETTGRMNERDFPHLVELALPPGGFQVQDQQFDVFHRERGIPIRCGTGRQDEGQFYVRFCFPSAGHAQAFRDRFGGEYMTCPPKRFRRQRIALGLGQKYEPRLLGGRIVLPDELERIHNELLQSERIGAVSDEMRELVEQVWPELVNKLGTKETT